MNNLSAIQASIYSALNSVPQTYPVYDAVPQGAAKPYIVIGEWTGALDDELAYITTDATITLHTWSAKAGKLETHAMLQFIRERLDGQPIPATWMFNEDFVEIMEDPSSTAASRLYHGVARYEVRVEDGTVLPPLGQYDFGQYA